MKPILFSICLAAANAATITQFTSQASYDAPITGSENFSFVAPSGTAVTTIGPYLGVSTIGGDSQGLVDENSLCGSSSSGIDCFKPLLFNFLQPGSAFGFHDGDLTSDEEFVVILNFANGDPAQHFTGNLGGQSDFTPIFFGVTSDVNLSSVEIYSRDIGNDSVGQRANTVVDLDLPGSAAPEPSLMGGVGLALVALGWCRKRKG